MIFSRASALKQYEKLGMLKIREKADKGVPVRILIGIDSPVNLRDLERLVGIPRLKLRYLLKSIKTKLTTIVTDRELSLVIFKKKKCKGEIRLDPKRPLIDSSIATLVFTLPFFISSSDDVT